MLPFPALFGQAALCACSASPKPPRAWRWASLPAQAGWRSDLRTSSRSQGNLPAALIYDPGDSARAVRMLPNVADRARARRSGVQTGEGPPSSGGPGGSIAGGAKSADVTELFAQSTLLVPLR